MKQLIVNADDLGHSTGINAGIFEAHERGLVTSATLMVGFPAAEAAARELARHPNLGVGLHTTLTGVGAPNERSCHRNWFRKCFGGRRTAGSGGGGDDDEPGADMAAYAPVVLARSSTFLASAARRSKSVTVASSTWAKF